MPFVKLDCGMVDSTIWIDREAREVFITALLMATPREFEEPIPQIAVDKIEETGFVAPPGWYGYVASSGPGIVRRASVPQEAGMEALKRLGDPDSASRSQEYSGRRMIRIDGGYLILNFMKYRDRDYGAAERMRKLRARRKGDVTPERNGVTPEQLHIAESREQSTDKNKSKSRASALPPDFDLTDSRRQYALGKGIANPEEEMEAFKAHHTAHGKTMKNWDAAWRTWCINAKRFGARHGTEKPRRLSAVDRVRIATAAHVAKDEQETDRGTLAPDDGDVRPQVGKPVR